MKTGNVLAAITGLLLLQSTVYAEDLSPPSNVAASDGAYFARVEITWDAVAGAAFYRVSRCLDRGNTCGFPIAGPAGTRFNDSKGNAGQIYYYRVRACTTLVCSKFSIADPGFRAMTLKEEVAYLKGQVADLTTLLSGVTRTTMDDIDTLELSGMNVRIVNGEGSTATANGSGNLIVGYNEKREEVIDGTPCIDLYAVSCNRRGGSHNVIVGDRQNFTMWGGLVTGIDNEISGQYSSVSGGGENIADGYNSSVSGGHDNIATGDSSSISGGRRNTASGKYAAISGGHHSRAVGDNSSISGGGGHLASGESASVSGGDSNSAHGIESSISGGRFKTADEDWCIIGDDGVDC